MSGKRIRKIFELPEHLTVREVGGRPIGSLSAQEVAAEIERVAAKHQSETMVGLGAMSSQLATAAADHLATIQKKGNKSLMQRSANAKAFVKEENQKLLDNPHLLGKRALHASTAKVRAEWVAAQMKGRFLKANNEDYSVETIRKWIYTKG